ncbi:mucin-5AC isoform X3 [Nematostella vectensis]|uniref:mucin-5AC isoform X3 n=1 Tax=Nematostella vectensis TaxID=45351 RepID=UPI002076E306|nr:mucin-5AC isoform X3 [Nematostella vectensis]
MGCCYSKPKASDDEDPTYLKKLADNGKKKSKKIRWKKTKKDDEKTEKTKKKIWKFGKKKKKTIAENDPLAIPGCSGEADFISSCSCDHGIAGPSSNPTISNIKTAPFPKTTEAHSDIVLSALVSVDSPISPREHLFSVSSSLSFSTVSDNPEDVSNVQLELIEEARHRREEHVEQMINAQADILTTEAIATAYDLVQRELSEVARIRREEKIELIINNQAEMLVGDAISNACVLVQRELIEAERLKEEELVEKERDTKEEKKDNILNDQAKLIVSDAISNAVDIVRGELIEEEQIRKEERLITDTACFLVDNIIANAYDVVQRELIEKEQENKAEKTALITNNLAELIVSEAMIKACVVVQHQRRDFERKVEMKWYEAVKKKEEEARAKEEAKKALVTKNQAYWIVSGAMTNACVVVQHQRRDFERKVEMKWYEAVKKKEEEAKAKNEAKKALVTKNQAYWIVNGAMTNACVVVQHQRRDFERKVEMKWYEAVKKKEEEARAKEEAKKALVTKNQAYWIVSGAMTNACVVVQHQRRDFERKVEMKWYEAVKKKEEEARAKEEAKKALVTKNQAYWIVSGAMTNACVVVQHQRRDFERKVEMKWYEAVKKKEEEARAKEEAKKALITKNQAYWIVSGAMTNACVVVQHQRRDFERKVEMKWYEAVKKKEEEARAKEEAKKALVTKNQAYWIVNGAMTNACVVVQHQRRDFERKVEMKWYEAVKKKEEEARAKNEAKKALVTKNQAYWIVNGAMTNACVVVQHQRRDFERKVEMKWYEAVKKKEEEARAKNEAKKALVTKNQAYWIVNGAMTNACVVVQHQRRDFERKVELQWLDAIEKKTKEDERETKKTLITKNTAELVVKNAMSMACVVVQNQRRDFERQFEMTWHEAVVNSSRNLASGATINAPKDFEAEGPQVLVVENSVADTETSEKISSDHVSDGDGDADISILPGNDSSEHEGTGLSVKVVSSSSSDAISSGIPESLPDLTEASSNDLILSLTGLPNDRLVPLWRASSDRDYRAVPIVKQAEAPYEMIDLSDDSSCSSMDERGYEINSSLLLPSNSSRSSWELDSRESYVWSSVCSTGTSTRSGETSSHSSSDVSSSESETADTSSFTTSLARNTNAQNQPERKREPWNSPPQETIRDSSKSSLFSRSEGQMRLPNNLEISASLSSSMVLANDDDGWSTNQACPVQLFRESDSKNSKAVSSPEGFEVKASRSTKQPTTIQANNTSPEDVSSSESETADTSSSNTSQARNTNAQNQPERKREPWNSPPQETFRDSSKSSLVSRSEGQMRLPNNLEISATLSSSMVHTSDDGGWSINQACPEQLFRESDSKNSKDVSSLAGGEVKASPSTKQPTTIQANETCPEADVSSSESETADTSSPTTSRARNTNAQNQPERKREPWNSPSQETIRDSGKSSLVSRSEGQMRLHKNLEISATLSSSMVHTSDDGGWSINQACPEQLFRESDSKNSKDVSSLAGGEVKASPSTKQPTTIQANETCPEADVSSSESETADTSSPTTSRARNTNAQNQPERKREPWNSPSQETIRDSGKSSLVSRSEGQMRLHKNLEISATLSSSMVLTSDDDRWSINQACPEQLFRESDSKNSKGVSSLAGGEVKASPSTKQPTTVQANETCPEVKVVSSSSSDAISSGIPESLPDLTEASSNDLILSLTGLPNDRLVPLWRASSDRDYRAVPIVKQAEAPYEMIDLSDDSSCSSMDERGYEINSSLLLRSNSSRSSWELDLRESYVWSSVWSSSSTGTSTRSGETSSHSSSDVSSSESETADTSSFTTSLARNTNAQNQPERKREPWNSPPQETIRDSSKSSLVSRSEGQMRLPNNLEISANLSSSMVLTSDDDGWSTNQACPEQLFRESDSKNSKGVSSLAGGEVKASPSTMQPTTVQSNETCPEADVSSSETETADTSSSTTSRARNTNAQNQPERKREPWNSPPQETIRDCSKSSLVSRSEGQMCPHKNLEISANLSSSMVLTSDDDGWSTNQACPEQLFRESDSKNSKDVSSLAEGEVKAYPSTKQPTTVQANETCPEADVSSSESETADTSSFTTSLARNTNAQNQPERKREPWNSPPQETIRDSSKSSLVSRSEGQMRPHKNLEISASLSSSMVLSNDDDGWSTNQACPEQLFRESDSKNSKAVSSQAWGEVKASPSTKQPTTVQANETCPEGEISSLKPSSSLRSYELSTSSSASFGDEKSSSVGSSSPDSSRSSCLLPPSSTDSGTGSHNPYTSSTLGSTSSSYLTAAEDRGGVRPRAPSSSSSDDTEIKIPRRKHRLRKDRSSQHDKVVSSSTTTNQKGRVRSQWEYPQTISASRSDGQLPSHKNLELTATLSSSMVLTKEDEWEDINISDVEPVREPATQAKESVSTLEASGQGVGPSPLTTAFVQEQQTLAEDFSVSVTRFLSKLSIFTSETEDSTTNSDETNSSSYTSETTPSQSTSQYESSSYYTQTTPSDSTTEGTESSSSSHNATGDSQLLQIRSSVSNLLNLAWGSREVIGGRTSHHRLSVNETEHTISRRTSADRSAEAISVFLTQVNDSRELTGLSPVDTSTAIKYLLASDYDAPKAIKLYLSCMRQRKAYKLENVSPYTRCIQKELSSGKLTVLPIRDETEPTVVLVNVSLHDPGTSDPVTAIQAISFQLDEATLSPITQKNGIEIIMDMSDSAFSNIDMDLSRRFLDIMQGGYPAKLNHVFIVSPPLWMRASLRFLVGFLSVKTREKIEIVSPRQLTERLPLTSVPVSLGGLAHVRHQAWLRQCVESFDERTAFSDVRPAMPGDEGFYLFGERSFGDVHDV